MRPLEWWVVAALVMALAVMVAMFMGAYVLELALRGAGL